MHIRPTSPDELATAVEIHNASLPREERMTVDQVRAWDNLLTDTSYPLRLLVLVDSVPVATGQVMQTPFDPAGRFRLSMAVHPGFRRRGIGRELYGVLFTHAAEHNARELSCVVHEQYVSSVENWLAREGFRESERTRRSELLLDQLNMRDVAEAEQRVESAGIALTTLAADDTEENRRKLWQLEILATRDVPFATAHPDMAWDRFHVMISQPQNLKDCLVVARDGERSVGMTMVGDRGERTIYTYFTGVHPDYRGRGIAYAVKMRCARLARDRGYAVMQTSNHLENAAMLAVNRRMGYHPLPERILYVRPMLSAE